jgi:hypothetical protein
MTEETRYITEDDEATLVSPRFDDEETVVARRVVPLAAAAEGARAASHAQAPARPSRRAWVLALAFASALGGGVLSGVGLYLYQSRASLNPPPAAERVNAPAEAARPAQDAPQPSPTAEAPTDSPAQAEQQHDAAVDAPQAAPPAEESRDENESGADEAGKSRAADARDDSGDDARPGARKHGKKGEHDEELRRLGRRADQESRPATADGEEDASADRKPRRLNTVFERPRRADRSDRARRERPRPVNSIRGIFEGQP